MGKTSVVKRMIASPGVIGRIARSVQPLVFETGILEFPYSTAGTVFLVGYEKQPFIITTRHSLNPENIGPICIFPSDTSHRIIPLKDVFFVARDDEPEDFVDLAVIAIDTAQISHSEVAQATLIDLALALGDWKSDLGNTDFFTLGYPEDHSFVEYDTQILHNERITLRARYIGRSIIPYLHEIKISDQYTLSTFSGFSGSPVFAYIQRPNVAPETILCGMVIRGSSQSGKMHFLDRSVLLDALKIKKAQLNKQVIK